MKAPLYIAKRWINSAENKKRLASPIIKLGVVATGLSVAIMILSIAIVSGFQEEIRERVIGFGSHIQLLNLDSNNSYETSPIPKNLDFLNAIRELPGIKHIQSFATKPGILKTKTDNQAVIVKGVGADYNFEFIQRNLVEGKMMQFSDTTKSNEILMSKKIANLLNLKINDRVFGLFYREGGKPRYRPFDVCGIYETSLEEFDKQFIFADIRHIQTLNEWNDNQVSGFEILINNFDHLNSLTHEVRSIAGYKFLDDGSRLKVVPINDRYSTIFDWLGLLDMNKRVIILILALIAIINMISVLIIVILDRISSIGLLKALGTTDQDIRQIFLYQATYIIGRGLIIGNIVAIGFGYLQNKFHIIKLNKSSYFIDYAPVSLGVGWLVLLNIIAILIILLFMLFPSMMISKVDPVKTLRYE
ncbi:MAG: ABC transporter permease [Bacteroidales bacterium]|nr:ABC transporter permease [Bacteroidales bacterium]